MIFMILSTVLGGGTGRDGGPDPRIFLTFRLLTTFKIMPIGVAWKEFTSNGPRPPQSSCRGAAHVDCLCQ